MIGIYPARQKAPQHYITDIGRMPKAHKRLIAITSVGACADRFRSKVDTTPGQGSNGDCHEWTASRLPSGYGRFYVDGEIVQAHRIAYDLAHPDETLGSRLACHHCDNPPCCRAEHLFAGTHRDNALDAVAKGRHSKRGSFPPGFKRAEQSTHLHASTEAQL